MFKLILWLAGAVGFLALIARNGYWHEAAALAVLCGAFVWIVGGAALIARGGRGGFAAALRKGREAAELQRAAADAQRKEREKAGT